MRAARGLLGSAIALSLTLGGVQPSYADTITVNNGESIQDAINSASSGDTIQIKSGTYFEHDITIPAGLTDLTIRVPLKKDVCQDEETVIIDANGGKGFIVGGDSTRFYCLTVRFGTIGFDVAANNFKLDHVETLRQTDRGVVIVGDDFEIKNAEIIQAANGGLFATGNDGSINETTSRNHNGPCFVLSGDSLRLDSDQAENCNGVGFSVTGDGADLDSNSAIGNAGRGFQVVGEANVVRNSSAESQNGAGFFFDCTGSCDNAEVSENTSKHSLGGNPGFLINAATNGMTVNDNTAELNSAEGFRLAFDDGSIRSNRATRNGSAAGINSVGFNISGADNTIDSNTAQENADDGFRINGASNTLSKNKAQSNLVDGIELESGAGNTLDRNTTQRNGGEGIELKAASGTFTTSNTSQKNRLDCASAVALASNVKNKCKDGSNFATPGQIDRPARRPS